MRNQCLNAPQANPPAHNLADTGWVAPRTRLVPMWGSGGELPDRRMSSVRKAMVKACGIAMAMVQGHNWVPIPSNGQQRTWEPCRWSQPVSGNSPSRAGRSVAD